MSDRTKTHIKTALKLSVAFALLYFALRKIDQKLLLESIQDPISLLINLVFSAVISALLSLRWQQICRHLNFGLTFLRAFHTFMVSIFVGSTVFGSFTSDLTRIYLVAQDHPEKKIKASLSVVLDRIVSILGLLAYTSLAILFFISSISYITEIQAISDLLQLGALLTVVALFAAPFIARISAVEEISQKYFPKFYEFKNVYANKPSRFYSLVLLTLAGSFLYSVLYWIQSQRLGLEATLPQLLIFVPMSSLLSYLSFLPFGIGVLQWLFYAFYQGISPEAATKAVLVATNIQMGSFVFQLFGFFFYLKGRKSLK